MLNLATSGTERVRVEKGQDLESKLLCVLLLTYQLHVLENVVNLSLGIVIMSPCPTLQLGEMLVTALCPTNTC